MQDIAPKLYEKIREDFHNYMDNDRQLQSLLKKINKGNSDHDTARFYANRVGACASKALLKNIKEDVLPNGKVYYNIAERVIKPILQEAVEIVSSATSKVQEAFNKDMGVNMKAVMPDEVKELING